MNDQGPRDLWRKLFKVAAIALVLFAAFYAYVLISFTVPQMAKGKQRRTVVALQTCSLALESYRQVHGGYPDGDWASVVRVLVDGQWLEEPLLRDYWGHPLVYRPSRKAGEPLAVGYTLRSCGENGACEQQLPSSVEFDKADYQSDIVIQDGNWRRAPSFRDSGTRT